MKHIDVRIAWGDDSCDAKTILMLAKERFRVFKVTPIKHVAKRCECYDKNFGTFIAGVRYCLHCGEKQAKRKGTK